MYELEIRDFSFVLRLRFDDDVIRDIVERSRVELWNSRKGQTGVDIRHTYAGYFSSQHRFGTGCLKRKKNMTEISIRVTYTM